MSQWSSTSLGDGGASLFELLDAENAASSSPNLDEVLSSPSQGSSSPVSPYSAASPPDDMGMDLCNGAPMSAFDDFSSNLIMEDVPANFSFPGSDMDFDLLSGSGATDLLSLEVDPMLSAAGQGVAAAHCLQASEGALSCPPMKPVVDQKPSKSIKKKKSTRKPKKAAPAPSLSNKRDLNFTREEVLTMTCEQLDKIVENIQQTRELTKEEDLEVRKQRRLIKNRESAAASRKRKRGMVEELEMKMAAFKAENDDLKERLTRLSTENEDLRERLARATGNSAWRLGRGSMPSAKAGLCLMVVLLSFGLVFNQFEPTPGSNDLIASALTNYQFPAVSTLGRVAPEFSGEALTLPKQAQNELASPARRQLLAAGSGYSLIVDEDQHDPAVIEPMVIDSRDSTITVDHMYDPNVTYITIVDGKQEGRSLDESFPEDGSPFLIELIIPTESTPMGENTLGYQSSLEITCKVIETRLSTRVLGSRGELSSAASQGSGMLSVI